MYNGPLPYSISRNSSEKLNCLYGELYYDVLDDGLSLASSLPTSLRHRDGMHEEETTYKVIKDKSLSVLMYKGPFKDSFPDGQNAVIYNPKTYKPMFIVDIIRGKKTGEGKWYNSNLSLRFEGNFKNGGIHQKEIQLFYDSEQKPIFTGNILNGELSGYGVINYINQNRIFYKGNFEQGELVGDLLNDRYDDGICEFYDRDKMLRIQGKLDSDWKLTKNCKEYTPGTKFVRYHGNFIKGKKYQKDAILNDTQGHKEFFGDIHDNLPLRRCCTFHPKYKGGTIFQTGNFIDGVLTDKDARQYYETGELYYHGGMIGNQFEGHGVFYHKNGFKRTISNFKNNQKFGDTIHFNEKGYKIFHGDLKNNKKDGRGRIYYDNGIFACSLMFSEDKYVGDRICLTGQSGKLVNRAEGYKTTNMSFRGNLNFWLKDESKKDDFLKNFKFAVEYYPNGQIMIIGDKKMTYNGKINWSGILDE